MRNCCAGTTAAEISSPSEVDTGSGEEESPQPVARRGNESSNQEDLTNEVFMGGAFETSQARASFSAAEGTLMDSVAAVTETTRRNQGFPSPSSRNTKAQLSVSSSISLDTGLPAPWPAWVSSRSRMG